MSFIVKSRMSLKALNNEVINAAMNFGLLTDAQGDLATSLIPTLAKLAPLLPYIVGIGAAIGAIAIGVSAYKKAHPSLEMLQKDADAAKQEFDEMQSKVDETKKRIDELNKLKESGGLSSTEQAELDNLTSQNAQYERQLELLKQIAKYKQDTADKKANDDAVSALNRFLKSDDRQLARQDPDRAPGMTRVMLESHKNGLGGLLNAIDDYTAASEKLEAANKALSDAELEGADEKTLEGLRDDIKDAEKRLSKQREILADFQDFLIGIRGDLTDKKSIATVDSWLDTIATTLGIADSDKTFDNFKKGLKGIGDDADEVVNKFLNNEKLTEDQSRRLAQCLVDMGYSAEDVATYFDRMAQDMATETEKSVNSQISNYTSLRDELTATSAALEAYKKALEGGEKGDAAKQMADIYKAAIADIDAGKMDTRNLQAAADLFFSQDWLASNDYDLSAVGEALSSGIWEAVFTSDGDYGVAFANYIKDNLSGLGDAFDIIDNHDGTFQFAYSSLSDIAEATNMSEEAISALLDALDAFGVEVMMSQEDLNNLANNLDFSQGIDGIIQQLADGKNSAYEIVSILHTLDANGMIDLSGVDDLGERVQEVTNNVTTLDTKSAEPEVDVNGNAVDTLERIKSLLAEIDGTSASANVSVAGFIGGIVGKIKGQSKGTRNAPGGPTLLAEGEGPELVSDNGNVELITEPSIRNLHKGATVLNAKETRRVLGGRYSNIPKNGFSFGTTNRSLALTDSGHRSRKMPIKCPRCSITNPGGRSTCIACGWNLSTPYNYKKFDAPGQSIPNLNNGSGKSSGGGSSGGGSTGSSSSSTIDDTQKIDWIEVAIDRIKRKVSSLAKTAESSFKSLSKRLTASKDEISAITQEIETQRRGYDRYMKEAESVGLSSDLAKLVREGAIDIRSYDKDTQKLISDYQNWYEKALACSEAVEDLKENLAELYQSRFEAVQGNYENRLSDIEHQLNMYSSTLDAHQKSGYMDSAEYYQQLAQVQANNANLIERELSDLRAYMKQAMDSGLIEEGSDAYYEMKQAIQSVEEELDDVNIQIIECNNSIRDIQWQYFDYALERMSRLTDETAFFVELLSSSKLFDDSGKMTSEGLSTLGLYAVNYDTYMAQADKYANEIAKLDQEIAKDPYNTTLLERRESLLDLQRDSILAAQKEKEAVKSLIEDGFNKELSALKDLISSYTDALDSAKELHDYEKKIGEKTENIANIRKQLTAYAGDGSEENRSRLQKLQKQLKEAEEDLQETEYEQYIKGQKEILDNLYDEYEQILNERLDDIDALMGDMLLRVDDNTKQIQDTLVSVGESVGYSISNGLRDIFVGNDVVANYGYDSRVTAYLETIEAAVIAMANANGASISAAVKKYATGGIVDYTGIAMVDGSPGKPELVLNPSDTANFLKLRDTLRAPYLGALSQKPFNSSVFSPGSGTTIGEINMPIQIAHVDDYNDFVRQLQSDPKLEKIIQAMTIDRLNGKSSLRKKYIS